MRFDPSGWGGMSGATGGHQQGGHQQGPAWYPKGYMSVPMSQAGTATGMGGAIGYSPGGGLAAGYGVPATMATGSGTGNGGGNDEGTYLGLAPEQMVGYSMDNFHMAPSYQLGTWMGVADQEATQQAPQGQGDQPPNLGHNPGFVPTQDNSQGAAWVPVSDAPEL